MAKVLGDAPGQSPPPWLIQPDVHSRALALLPTSSPGWGLPGSGIAPPFTHQTRYRACSGGACTGAGLAMGTGTWLMSFLDAGIWTEATLINLYLITGRKGEA